ncbi:MAG: hypothetical protein AAF542_08445 [Pseudomonadota bacterium]
MNLFYERSETEDEISLTINRHTLLYVVISAFGSWASNKYLGSNLLTTILQLNWVVAMIIALVYFFKALGLRKDFVAMRSKDNYTMTGKTYSLNNPLTYHIKKGNTSGDT